MIRRALLSAIAVAVVGVAPVRAEPAFAVRTRTTCGQCHVNRTGGGMRTPFGSIYAQTILPSRLLRFKDKGYLLPADPEARFAYGGDVRAGYYAVDSHDAEDTSSFEIPAANVYGLLRIVPERLGFYVDQRLGPGASSSRELFALLSFRPGNGYVKLGRFIPPYGWALPDDTAFVREPLGFAFSAPELGVEVGFEPGKWSTHLALVNGSAAARDVDRGKKVTLLATRRFDRSSVGLSAAEDVSRGATTTWAGLMGGVTFGRFSLLAEGDWRRTSPDAAPSSDTWVGFFEANFLIERGMNVKYAHDWIDPSRSVRTDQRQRDSLGFEYVPYPFVQLRAFVRHGDGPPQVAGSRDTRVDLEAHLFF